MSTVVVLVALASLAISYWYGTIALVVLAVAFGLWKARRVSRWRLRESARRFRETLDAEPQEREVLEVRPAAPPPRAVPEPHKGAGRVEAEEAAEAGGELPD